MSVVTSFRPFDGQPLGHVEESTSEAVAAAVDSARRVATAVADSSPATRRGWLDAIASVLLARVDEIAEMADAETGLGLPRLRGEVARAAGQLNFYGSVAEEGSYLGVTIDRATASNPRLVRVNRPLGAVAVFAASNFPLAFGVLGNDTGSAIAAGCPVVVKAHPAHALLSERLAELGRDALEQAGAPDGVLTLITGHQAGLDLVAHPGISAVGFTGSQSGGLALWKLANDRDIVIPVFAEMGTVNPVVLTPAAVTRLPEIAAGFVGSFTLGSGQFCTKPGLLLAPAGHRVAEAVAAALADAALSPVLLTERIARSAAHDVGRLLDAGARVVGRVEGSGEGWSADALVLEAPASAIQPGSALLEECFGPVAVVVEYADETERDAVLDTLQGSLTGTVVTDASDADSAAPAIIQRLAAKVGRVTVNDWPTGVAWTWAQHHGGPWPSTSAPATTSVGAAALDRWVRPVTFQSAEDAWVPEPARAGNPWGVPRRVDGVLHAP